MLLLSLLGDGTTLWLSQLQALLPDALRLLQPALSRMASQWRLPEARQAVEGLDGLVPGVLLDSCKIYIDGVNTVLLAHKNSEGG